jgi:hypothetical protein
MNLVLPTVGSTLGPDWAEQLNSALELVDLHDHTAGSGVQIPTAGISIDSDLSFNGFNAASVNSVVLSTDTAGANKSLYEVSGELYYKDGNGNAVAITNLGSVNAATGSFTGLSAPAAATFTANKFVWTYDTGEYAPLESGDVILHPYDGLSAYSNYISLKAPTTLATNYSLTLPATLPANTNFMQVSSGGTITYSNTITQPVLAAAGSSTAPTYSFSSDSNTGIYNPSGDSLGLTAGGTLRLTVASTITSTVPILNALGSTSAVAYSFTGDPNTGMYSSGSDSVSLVAGGAARITATTAGASVNGTLQATGAFSGTSGTFSGAVSAASYGNIVATSIDLAGGGAFKVKFVPFSIASISSGSSGLASVSHGISSGLTYIMSITGYYKPNTSSLGFPVGTGETTSVSYSSTTTYNNTTASLTVYNNSGSSSGTVTGYFTIIYV